MLLVFLLGLVAPRVGLGYVWIFTDRVDRAFAEILWPILGILLLPWGTIMYVLLWSATSGVADFEWVLVGVAAAVDVLSWASRLASSQSPYG
jgi:hypothetical protein